MADFQPGERYERPTESSPSWAAEQLRDLLEEVDGEVRVRLEFNGTDNTEEGVLTSVGGPPTAPMSAVSLEGYETSFDADQIVAFKILI